jgi:hypothetical protein
LANADVGSRSILVASFLMDAGASAISVPGPDRMDNLLEVHN